MRGSKRWVAVGAVVLIAAAVCFMPRKPLKNIKPSDVISAEVYLSPPDETVPIPDIPELVSYLNEVVTYQKDSSYTEYEGQGVFFTLTMSDGSSREIMAMSPFVVIDGTGYRTKHEACEKLNQYANELLRITKEDS